MEVQAPPAPPPDAAVEVEVAVGVEVAVAVPPPSPCPRRSLCRPHLCLYRPTCSAALSPEAELTQRSMRMTDLAAKSLAAPPAAEDVLCLCAIYAVCETRWASGANAV